jgi:asparagine synthase (glutamine-hydrolysing)
LALQGIEAYSLAMRGEDIFRRQIRDVQSTSVPALLHYEDRLSMAASVEVRLPFLDYRVVEYALQLPTHLKLNDGWSKWILRKSMEKTVPQQIIWRKDKQGFTLPQEQWFRQELKQEIKNLFDSSLLCEQLGLIHAPALRDGYNHFCSKKGQVSFKEIYNPFALEVWLQQYSSYLNE